MQTVLTIDIKGKERVYNVPVGWAFINDATAPKPGDRFFSDKTRTWVIVSQETDVPDELPVIRKERTADAADLILDRRYQAFVEV